MSQTLQEAITAIKARFTTAWTDSGSFRTDVAWQNGGYTKVDLTTSNNSYKPIVDQIYVRFTIEPTSSIEPGIRGYTASVTRKYGIIVAQIYSGVKDQDLGLTYAKIIESTFSKKSFDGIITQASLTTFPGRSGTDSRYETKVATSFYFEELE